MASIAFLEPYVRTADTQPPSTGDAADIIQVLFLSALKKIDQARLAHLSSRPVEKGFFLGRATTIVDALRDALNVESGGQAARDFDRVYDHIDLCLQISVREDTIGALAQAREAVCQLSACWQAMSCKSSLLKGTA